MYYTEMDLINAKLSAMGAMNESEIIKYILNEDINSRQKKAMADGVNYYNGRHDVFEKDFRSQIIEETENENGKEITERKNFKNPNRSNHHNAHLFHKLLVNQKVSYIVGKEPTVTVDKADKTFQSFVSDMADETFDEMLQRLVKGASNKGCEALHFYYDSDGKLNYCIVPAEELILVYDTEYQKNLEQVIRYYNTKVIKGGVTYNRRKVEWWTNEGVTFYTEKEENVFVRDNDRVNPSPHWWSVTSLDGFEKRRVPMSWGRVPFVILENNAEYTTDLSMVKTLIDAYDLLSSEGTNNFLDLVELYWVIQGYGGETAGAIAKKLQINRAVNISDSQGSVTAQQVNLPVTERIAWLSMLRRDIYHFGMGIDIEDEKIGNAPSGVALKFRYANLKHKCELVSPSLKRVIKEFYWFMLADYNRRNGTAYNADSIKVTLNYSQIANDMETVQILATSEGMLSKKTQIENHPLVTDVNDELERLEEEEKSREDKYNDLNMTKPQDGDGIIEE